MQYIKLFF